MKVGIISLYYSSRNLGGLLQSYAMVSFLSSNGFEAEQICYDLSVTNSESRHYQRLRRNALLLSSGYKILYSKYKSIVRRIVKRNDHLLNEHINKQNSVFSEFELLIPHSNVVYNIDTIKDAASLYDAFITGSDQVWNLGLLAHDAMYLTFVDKKKIAYAVSMGKTSITEFEKKIFIAKIHDFSEIAVREKSLGTLINSLTDKKCVNVLDPTLLLTYDCWNKIENASIVPNEKYIFCYFLGDCKWQRVYVQKYADKHNLKIIDIPYIMGSVRKSDLVLKSEKHYDVGPREFIALIKNAVCVFTDSFHAVAFSVNFQTDFYVFDRDGLSGSKSINSRITDFLGMLSLSSRRVTTPHNSLNNDSIEWKKVNSILDEQRIKSQEWLIRQLMI